MVNLSLYPRPAPVPNVYIDDHVETYSQNTHQSKYDHYRVFLTAEVVSGD